MASGGCESCDPAAFLVGRQRFRILRDEGFTDPLLSMYESNFLGIGDQSEVWSRVDDRMELRFPDPKGRETWRAGPSHRLRSPRAMGRLNNSLDDGSRRIWHQVAAEFESVWDKPGPPLAER